MNSTMVLKCGGCGTVFEQEQEQTFEGLTRSAEFMRDILLEPCPDHGGRSLHDVDHDDWDGEDRTAELIAEHEHYLMSEGADHLFEGRGE